MLNATATKPTEPPAQTPQPTPTENKAPEKKEDPWAEIRGMRDSDKIIAEFEAVGIMSLSEFGGFMHNIHSPEDHTDEVAELKAQYTASISRLGRSTKDLLNIIDALTDKGVILISHKENIDTDTPAGKFMLTVFAALSQLEREQLKQRQREGIEIAKAQGKYTGRKPIEIDWTRFGQLYGEWKSKSITGRDFMRRMGLSANTFYRRVREYESTHGIAEPTSA